MVIGDIPFGYRFAIGVFAFVILVATAIWSKFGKHATSVPPESSRRTYGIIDMGTGTRIEDNIIMTDFGIIHGEPSSGGTDKGNIILEKRKKQN